MPRKRGRPKKIQDIDEGADEGEDQEDTEEQEEELEGEEEAVISKPKVTGDITPRQLERTKFEKKMEKAKEIEAPKPLQMPVLDEDMQRMTWAFNNGAWCYGEMQLIKELDEDHIAIAFFEPFALKYTPFSRFVVILSKSASIDLAKAILDKNKK